MNFARRILLTILPFSAAVVAAYYLLPENCTLMGYQDSGLSCDSLPNSCCPANNSWVTAAQITVVLGLICSVIIHLLFRRHVSIEDSIPSITVIKKLADVSGAGESEN